MGLIMKLKFIILGFPILLFTRSINAQEDLLQSNPSLRTNHFYNSVIDEKNIVSSVTDNLDFNAFKTFNNTYKLPNGYLVNERIRLGWNGTSWQNGFRETFYI